MQNNLATDISNQWAIALEFWKYWMCGLWQVVCGCDLSCISFFEAMAIYEILKANIWIDRISVSAKNIIFGFHQFRPDHQYCRILDNPNKDEINWCLVFHRWYLQNPFWFATTISCVPFNLTQACIYSISNSPTNDTSALFKLLNHY